MNEKAKDFDPWVGESLGDKKDKKGILKSIQNFLISLAMGVIGLASFVVCFLVAFRHGAGFAEISILELFLFFWASYCFKEVKVKAMAQGKNVFFAIWDVFVITGGLTLLSCLIAGGWFRWGSDNGFEQEFLASNTFEHLLMAILFIGCFLGLIQYQEDEGSKGTTQENFEIKGGA